MKFMTLNSLKGNDRGRAWCLGVSIFRVFKCFLSESWPLKFISFFAFNSFHENEHSPRLVWVLVSLNGQKAEVTDVSGLLTCRSLDLYSSHHASLVRKCLNDSSDVPLQRRKILIFEKNHVSDVKFVYFPELVRSFLQVVEIVVIPSCPQLLLQLL